MSHTQRTINSLGMRQVGMLALAADFALTNHLSLLKEDHIRATRLADALSEMGFPITKSCDSNMVWVNTAPYSADTISAELAKQFINSFGGKECEMRLVIHHQISDGDVDDLIAVFRQFPGGK
jgi:threonine aldolase